MRGSSRPSPDLPYLPHSPFHLFSYDLDEEPSPPASAKTSEESPKTTSPRSDGQQSSISRVQEAQRVFPATIPTLHFSVSTSFSGFYQLGSLCTTFVNHHLHFSPVLLTSLTARRHTFSLSSLLLSPVVPFFHLFFFLFLVLMLAILTFVSHCHHFFLPLKNSTSTGAFSQMRFSSPVDL